MPRVQLPIVHIDDVSTLGIGAIPRPFIISRVPEPSESDVPVGTPIEIVVIDVGGAGLANSTQVTVHTVADGTVVAFNQGVGFDSTYSGSNFATAHSPGSSIFDEHKIQLIRNTPFLSQAVVTVTVTGATVDSKTLNTTYSFTIVDLTIPQIVSVASNGLTTLNVVFAEPVLMDSSTKSAIRVRPLSGRITFTAPDFLEAGNANFVTDNVRDYIAVVGAENAVNNAYFQISSLVSNQEVTFVETSIATEQSSLDVLSWTGPYKLVPIMEPELLIPTFTPAVIAANVIDQQTVQLTLDQELSPGRSYTLIANNISDVAFVPNVNPTTTCDFTAEPLPVVALRQLSLWDNFIPAINKRQDTSGDNQRFVRCLDEVTQLLVYDVDNFEKLQDVDQMPTKALDPTLANLGNPFTFVDDDLTKRKTINGLVQTFKDGGIDRGITNAVEFFLGLTVTVQPFNLLEGWILGVSSLGFDTILSTSEKFLIYSFEILSDTILTDTQKTIITEIANVIKPAHTHFVRFVEPG